MEYKNVKEKPEATFIVRVYGQAQHHVIVNLTENTDGTYDYEEIKLPVGVWDRDAIINAIVRAHYSQDKAESIVFNHLLTDDTEKEKHEAEYEAMQEWREKAKAWADEILEIGEKLG